MKKDIEWLKKGIEVVLYRANLRGTLPVAEGNLIYDDIVSQIDQLDEPEVLSQELPVIPKYVGEFIEDRKHVFVQTLQWVLHRAMDDRESDWFKEEYDWVRNNSETFARAWLDGYEVEKEKLYHIKFSENQYAQRFDESKIDSILVNEKELAGRFTEEQIKKMNPNLMALAVEVAE